MHRTKAIVIILIMSMLVLCLANFSNAATVNVSRDVYSNNGSMKFNFTGLTLDTTHEYEFGLTKTAASQVETWNLITEYTTTTATIDIVTTNKKLREVVNAVDKGYITIKDKTADKVVLDPYAVDLKIPYLQVTNYTVIANGKTFDKGEVNTQIQVPLRTKDVSEAYYQYEKITDQNVISEYKKIKSQNGDFLKLQSLLKKNVPSSNWASWERCAGWNEWPSTSDINGYGFAQKTVNVPDTGLYYMWIYFAGTSVKDMYGCILVDNLEADIAVESISLPSTEKVELGKTLTLTPTFNPTGATNKIVTWSSSDETIATVDNAGKVTPKKVGSVVITAVSKDGNKKATCTVTVTNASGNSNNTTNNTANNTTTNNTTSKNNTIANTSNKTNTVNDTTIKGGVLPKTGIGFGLIISIISLVGAGLFTYFKYNNLKDIK